MDICERCYHVLEDGEHGLYKCPLAPRRANAVRPDDIPGGLVIEHGLCNEDGTPRTYYSQSEIDRECAKRGFMRWTDLHTEDRTKEGRQRGEEVKSGDAERQRRWDRERKLDEARR